MEIIRAILIEPGKKAREVEIEHSLKALQEAVGGHIEWCPIKGTGSHGIIAYCNEDGKLTDLPCRAIARDGVITDVVFGNIIVTGSRHDPDGTDEDSLTDRQAAYIMKEYGPAQSFVWNAKGALVAVENEYIDGEGELI